MNELIKRKIVKVYKDNTFSKPKSIGINKNFKQWVLAKTLTVSENTNTVLAKTLTQSVSENTNQKKQLFINTNNKEKLLCTPTVHEYDDSFESFWKLYPKKVAKIRCYKYFVEMNLHEEIDEIVKGLEYLMKVDYSKKERQFILSLFLLI